MTLSLSRRTFLRAGAVGCGVSVSGWLGPLAALAGPSPQRKRACILLWLNGGPATIDLWDLKTGHENGGPTKEIATAVPGLKISEHLPKLAKWTDRMAIVRSMSTKEGDHARAAYLLRSGNLPQGAIQFPSIGALISKEIGDPKSELPNFVSIAPQRFFNLDTYGSGFLGPQYAPLYVAEGQMANQAGDGVDAMLTVKNLKSPSEITNERTLRRIEILRDTQEGFSKDRPGTVSESHVAAYDRAARLMQSSASKVFDLKDENAKLRDRYGRSLFGQGCLLARRLVEKGVPFVEITLSNWDTHQNNFDQIKPLAGILDQAWASLLEDLKDHGLLDTTMVICMGEFGRTPRINNQTGRDHFPNAWSAVLSGGGIKGGQAIGKTSPDGTRVVERPVSTTDLLATVALALGIDPEKQNMSNVGRPIRIVEKGAQPIREVIA